MENILTGCARENFANGRRPARTRARVVVVVSARSSFSVEEEVPSVPLGFVAVGVSSQLGFSLRREKQYARYHVLETDENDLQIHAREFYIRGEKTTVDESSGGNDRRFQSVSRGKGGGGGGEKEMEVVLGRRFWRPKSSNSDDEEEREREQR